MYLAQGQREESIQRVKDCFIKYQFATKSEIHEKTGLSLATVTNILQFLCDDKFIERVDDCSSTGGRKAKRYHLCGSYMLFGLINLKVIQKKTVVSIEVRNLNHEVVGQSQQVFSVMDEKTIVAIVQAMIHDYPIEYVSIAIPGIVEGDYISKCDINQLANCHLVSILEAQLPINVKLENDTNCAMLGYIDYYDTTNQSLAFIYQPDSNYSGCSLYINNQIVYGSTHFAGELGYLPFGSLDEQRQALKENPEGLLLKQMVSVIAIMNPSYLVVYAKQVDENRLKNELANAIPRQHLPIVSFIDDMETHVFNGLFYLSVEKSRYVKGENGQ